MKLLQWTANIFLVVAIIMYLIAAFYGVKFLAGFMAGEDLRQKSFSTVLFGLVLMVAATGIGLAIDAMEQRSLWEPVLAVNILDVLLNAAVLHTIYRKWSYRWTAGLSVATLFVDANLRFLLLYFLS